jgi:hypothetical protein
MCNRWQQAVIQMHVFNSVARHLMRFDWVLCFALGVRPTCWSFPRGFMVYYKLYKLTCVRRAHPTRRARCQLFCIAALLVL